MFPFVFLPLSWRVFPFLGWKVFSLCLGAFLLIFFFFWGDPSLVTKACMLSTSLECNSSPNISFPILANSRTFASLVSFLFLNLDSHLGLGLSPRVCHLFHFTLYFSKSFGVQPQYHLFPSTCPYIPWPPKTIPTHLHTSQITCQ